MLVDEQKREFYLKFAAAQAEQAKLVAEKCQQQLQLNKQREFLRGWSDPNLQAYTRQIVMMHVVQPNLWTQERIREMGPEGVPALVEGINLGADFHIGFV
jgi:hypothetical protein